MYYYTLNDAGIAMPCNDFMKWARFLEHGREKHHLKDEIAGLRLSTVFLGIDHNYGTGDPLLWETMLFNDDEASTHELSGHKFESSPEMGQWRFMLKAEAHAFHKNKMIELHLMLKEPEVIHDNA